MAKAFPKVVFVKIEKDNDGSTYLVAYESVTELAEVGKDVKVAQFIFDREVTIKTIAEVVEAGRF